MKTRIRNRMGTAFVVLGLTTVFAAAAVGQDTLETDPSASLAIREAQLLAREAELDERERQIEAQESDAPCSDAAPIANYGPPLPEGLPLEAIVGESQSEAATPDTEVAAEETESTAPADSVQADSGEVARTLKAMKPKKAALVVVQLDLKLAAESMTQLSARNRAKILDHVPPARAAMIAAALGESR